MACFSQSDELWQLIYFFLFLSFWVAFFSQSDELWQLIYFFLFLSYQVACFSQSDELWQFFTDQRCIVGVPPELEEENARHAQVLPTDNEP